MVKPKFTLRLRVALDSSGTDYSAICPTGSSNGSSAWKKRKSKAHAIINRENINLKNAQLQEAVDWCIINEARGWAALKTGMFPLIKDARSVNSRLDGGVQNGAEREYCSILTNKEEEAVVRHVKNKNRLV